MNGEIKHKYNQGTQQVLDESKKEKNPYEVLVLGKKFIVLPNVFSPKYFNDTELFAKNLPIKEGDEVLEIGPGSGAISITAACRGAGRVVAIDINPTAVDNTKRNINLHHLSSRVEVRQGDLYDALNPGEKFDVIFWNTPFGFIEEKDIPDLEKAVFDPGYKSTKRFIKDADKYLKKNGRLYVGFSSTLGNLQLLENFCKEGGKTLRLIFEQDSNEVYPVKFEIFEVVKK